MCNNGHLAFISKAALGGVTVLFFQERTFREVKKLTQTLC